MYILARCVRSWRPPEVMILPTTSEQCGAWVTNLIPRKNKNKKGTWPMATSSSRPAFSLRVKLVLSYLGVALGAMLLLIIVVSVVVQNYFYSTQRDQLRASAEFVAQQIGQIYHSNGESWDAFREPINLRYSPDLFIVAD